MYVTLKVNKNAENISHRVGDLAQWLRVYISLTENVSLVTNIHIYNLTAILMLVPADMIPFSGLCGWLLYTHTQTHISEYEIKLKNTL